MAFSGPFDLTLSGAHTVFPGPGGTGTSRVQYAPTPAPVQGLTLGPSTAAFNPGAGLFEGPVPGGAESITGMLSGPGTPSVGGGEPGAPSAPSAPSGTTGPTTSASGFTASGLGNQGGFFGNVIGGLKAINANTPTARFSDAMGLGPFGQVGMQVALNTLGGVVKAPLSAIDFALGAFGPKQTVGPETMQGLNEVVGRLNMFTDETEAGPPGTTAPTGGLGLGGGASDPDAPDVGVGPSGTAPGGGASDPDTPGPSGPAPDAPAPDPDTGSVDPSGAAGPGGGPGDSTVICTVLYKHGYLDERTWLADRLFGSMLDPAVYAGYLRWATPVADLMERSPVIRWLVSLVACPWARAMAGERNLIGDLVMRLGVPLCRWLGTRWATR